MKRHVLLLAIIISSFTLTCVQANTETILSVTPEINFTQMWAFETYTVNLTLSDLNVTEYAEHDLTGVIIAEGIVRWRGTGQYHHGGGVTGYSYDLADADLLFEASLDDPTVAFNLTMSKDAYRYGTKPFENVEITINLGFNLEVHDGDNITKGPVITTFTKRYILIDDEKVEYITEMLDEMSEDINIVTSTPGLPDFNRTKYDAMINEMNSSLTQGNYVLALDQWEKWDDKNRMRMVNAFSTQVETQTDQLNELTGVEADLERIQVEYDAIEDKYIALISNNRKNLAELEATKTGLTTAITGVFLSAIVFFFLGRRTINTEDM